MQDCSTSIQGIGLEQCLDQGNSNSNTIDNCCTALQHALEIGFNCLCFLLASTTPLLTTPLVLPLSKYCYVTLPPLTKCRGLVRPVPPLKPPASPMPMPMPVLLPPDIVKDDQPQTSAPTGLVVPTPPREVQIPVNSPTPSHENSTMVPWQPHLSANSVPDLSSVFTSGNVTSHGGHNTKILLHLSFFLAGMYFLCL
ncbi:classical arabinogalactan protein 9-like [Cornus florida]|uniref:classical arabinogalactan protein 9-like n=1 Tax=Cornus florida TaxID=4283 RepID=UPI002896EFD6|nr:classical arabinogalactan protein 9-like [Cornus florida]